MRDEGGGDQARWSLNAQLKTWLPLGVKKLLGGLGRVNVGFHDASERAFYEGGTCDVFWLEAGRPGEMRKDRQHVWTCGSG